MARRAAPIHDFRRTHVLSDTRIAEATKGAGWSVGPFIHARNSVLFDNRPPCCGSASCVPIGRIYSQICL